MGDFPNPFVITKVQSIGSTNQWFPTTPLVTFLNFGVEVRPQSAPRLRVLEDPENDDLNESVFP